MFFVGVCCLNSSTTCGRFSTKQPYAVGFCALSSAGRLILLISDVGIGFSRVARTGEYFWEEGVNCMFKALACGGADWGVVEELVEDDEKDPDTSRATAEGCDAVGDIEAFIRVAATAAPVETFLLILLAFEFATPFFPGIIAALLAAGWVLLLLLLLLLTRNNSLEEGCMLAFGCFRCGWSWSCL